MADQLSRMQLFGLNENYKMISFFKGFSSNMKYVEDISIFLTWDFHEEYFTIGDVSFG